MNATTDYFAQTPQPPYYAVIFTSTRKPDDDAGYGATADHMTELAKDMPGYLGIESSRTPDGVGITVSYWASEAAIANWKKQMDHAAAQDRGKRVWYQHYELRVARVERAYSGPEGR